MQPAPNPWLLAAAQILGMGLIIGTYNYGYPVLIIYALVMAAVTLTSILLLTSADLIAQAQRRKMAGKKAA